MKKTSASVSVAVSFMADGILSDGSVLKGEAAHSDNRE
jgi:hypothetical protein